uniref:HNH endonuclease n=1 Tax=Candidatus Kentrum sp. LFY TaxID=2126342 RepID=A0A450UNG0_9GAMM|nr:MAG: hypothetical protein BECKLFY1418B_GA0070995_105310 [Candidatus Kentron sp. LFY]
MTGTHVPVALRRKVHSRANGCREYCRIPEAIGFALHEIDHILPEHFHPRRDGWLESATPTGRATIFLLHLNTPEKVKERTVIIGTR